jgi:hypothetical protein
LSTVVSVLNNPFLLRLKWLSAYSTYSLWGTSGASRTNKLRMEDFGRASSSATLRASSASSSSCRFFSAAASALRLEAISANLRSPINLSRFLLRIISASALKKSRNSFHLAFSLSDRVSVCFTFSLALALAWAAASRSAAAFSDAAAAVCAAEAPPPSPPPPPPAAGSGAEGSSVGTSQLVFPDSMCA